MPAIAFSICPQTSMDFHPRCTKNFCNICHADARRWLQTQDSGPGHLRATSLSRQRFIKNALEGPRTRSMPKPVKRHGMSFMELPAEVRLQVYRECIRWDEQGEVKIHGWFKGGGVHEDGKVALYARSKNGLAIYASHRFMAQVLQLNRTIHVEAREEIMRYLNFRIEGKLPETHISQLRYWLTENALQFAREISLTIDFAVNPEPQVRRRWQGWAYYTRRNRDHNNTNLESKHLAELGSILSSMPNLRQVSLVLSLDTSGNMDSIRHLLGICKEDSRWIERLKIFRQHLGRTQAQTLKLKVCFSEWYYRGAIELMSKEMVKQQKESIIARLCEETFAAEIIGPTRQSTSRISWGI